MATHEAPEAFPEQKKTEPPMGNRERFLAACRCEPVDRPPVWLMRQAGRALPEYRALKEQHTFLELARTPELAAEVTLQPIRRFDFDAAVLFSDILVVPEAMGQPYHFRENGGGIEMEFTLRSGEDIRRLDHRHAVERLGYVAEALTLIRPALAGRTALLGFAGSPWTLARYMIEGAGVGKSDLAKQLYYTEPVLFGELLEKITSVVTAYLQMQIAAGAEAVQIFDSNGDLLADNAFEPASGRWIRDIITALDGQVPVILFSKGGLGRLGDFVATGANVLSVDWTQSLAQCRDALPPNVGVQGNLDPFLLTTTPQLVASETSRILRDMAGRTGHVFNLGHGVTPAAKLECIQALVDTVREVRP
jgi:uroporphyrinogen decarboxylase